MKNKLFWAIMSTINIGSIASDNAVANAIGYVLLPLTLIFMFSSSED